jgi:phosphatidylserine/phosphatidylglycerophosphate/cardiolipin synthase-like enzyme
MRLKRAMMISLAVLAAVSPAWAGISLTVHTSEPAYLASTFPQAENEIRIRCTRLTDLQVLRSLEACGSRGVMVRVVVDQLSPALTALAKRGNIHLRQTTPADRRRFFEKGEGRSYVLFDDYAMWLGVRAWSPTAWIGRSHYHSDLMNRGGFWEDALFETAWKRAYAVPNGARQYL